jgi:ubiquitin carboxyl-terminal hydrolase 8
MPSVTVLPPSPPAAFPSSSPSAPSSLSGFFRSSHPCSSFHPDPLNGSSRPFEDMSVAEIKERAIQQAQRASRGSSSISLIRSAKGQISLAQSCESAGDFKGALSAFTKAASLTQVFMDTADFKAESVPGKRGVLWKEFSEFQQVSCSPLSPLLLCSHHPLFSERVATLCSVHMP